MLFWPLALILACLVPLITTHEIWAYVRKVITKWVLSYALFMIFYLGFGYVSGTKEADFDPSGHMACALAAQLNYFATYLFFVELDERSKTVPETLFSKYELVVKVLHVIFVFTLIHACYSLFFAAFIFHSVVESVIGWAFGMAIVAVSFETDFFSDTVYELLMVPIKMCCIAKK